MLYRVRRISGVRNVRDEVAADPKEYLYVPFAHFVERFNGVVAPFRRWDEVKLASERFEKGLSGPLPDSHRAVALDVGVPAHAARSRAGSSHVPAQQEKVHDRSDIVDAVLLLRQTHRPSGDHPLRCRAQPAGSLDLLPGKPAAGDDFFPSGALEVVNERLESRCELLDERMIDAAHAAGIVLL